MSGRGATGRIFEAEERGRRMERAETLKAWFNAETTHIAEKELYNMIKPLVEKAYEKGKQEVLDQWKKDLATGIIKEKERIKCFEDWKPYFSFEGYAELKKVLERRA